MCSDVSDARLNDLCVSFSAEAAAKGIDLVCVNPSKKDDYAKRMARLMATGFDDIVVLAPVPAVITDASQYLAPCGVMNIFAGVARGTLADLDLGDVYLKDARFIGHSASLMSDFQLVLEKTNSGQLSPNRSVAAMARGARLATACVRSKKPPCPGRSSSIGISASCR